MGNTVKNHSKLSHLQRVNSSMDADLAEKFILTQSFTDSVQELGPTAVIFDEELYKALEMLFWGNYQLYRPTAIELPDLNSAVEDYYLRLEIKRAINSFKSHLRKIKGVVKIAYTFSGNTIAIWTLLKELDRKSLYRVYDIEQKILEEYPSLFFDFNALISTAEPIPSNFTQEDLV